MNTRIEKHFLLTRHKLGSRHRSSRKCDDELSPERRMVEHVKLLYVDFRAAGGCVVDDEWGQPAVSRSGAAVGSCLRS